MGSKMSFKTEKKVRSQNGFTLIELLVVIAIIGILAAIAIPQFTAYKQQSQDGAVRSDLHNLAVSMEGYYVTNTTYVGAVVGTIAAPGNLQTTYGFVPNVDNTGAVLVTLGAGGALAGGCGGGLTATCWSATAANAAEGTGTVYEWDSQLGGAQW